MHGALFYIVPLHKNYFKRKQSSEMGSVDIIILMHILKINWNLENLSVFPRSHS